MAITGDTCLTGTLTGTNTATWTHNSPVFKVTVTFKVSEGAELLYRIKLYKENTSRYGYNFYISDKNLGAVADNGGWGSTELANKCILHHNGTSNQSTTFAYYYPSNSAGTGYNGWASANIYDGDKFTLYAACQAASTSNCMNTITNTESFGKIMDFNVDVYTEITNVKCARTALTGKTLTAKGTFTAGNFDITQVYMLLYDKDKNFLEQYDFSELTSGQSHKFSGLTNGTTYYVVFGVNDGIDWKESSYVEFVTYKTVIPDGITTTATSVTIPEIRMTYATLSGITTPTDMCYEIYNPDGSIAASGTATITDGKTGSITVNGLNPATTYSMSAWPAGVTDAVGTASFTTKDAPGGLSVSVYSTTGETATITATWSGGSDETVTVAVTLNGVTKNITSKGGTAQFTGLSHATRYSYSATATGSETGQFGTFNGNVTTYGVNISAAMRSAKSIQINGFGFTTGSKGTDPTGVYYEVYNNSGSTVVVDAVHTIIDTGPIIIDGLSPRTAYKIHYWLDSPTDTSEWVDITTGYLLTGLSLSATASSGTTVTIQASWDLRDELDASCSVTLNGESKTVSNGGSVKFTGLDLGSQYTASGKVTGSEGGSSSASCDGKTYDINIDWVEAKTTSQTVKFSTVTGNSGNKDSSIRFKIKKSSDSSWGSEQTGSTSNTTISGLTSSTSYDIQYYITGVTDENGNLDVIKTDTFSTLGALSSLKFETTAVTGTTVTVKVTWSESDSTGIVATVKVNGVSKTISTKGGTLQFTGLTNGTQYTVSGSAKDNEGNTTTAPNISFTTYKVSITIEDTSTRAAKYKLEIVAGADTSLTIDYTCATSSTTSSPSTASSGNSKITDGLTHNTTYVVTAWIDNMKDENGNLDTKVTVSLTTKKLTLAGTGSSFTQHTITTQWQAYANGVTYDKCQLTNNAITFVISKCKNTPKATTGYQTTNKTGSVSGSYKTLESSGLCYYAYYTITCTVSDGVNEASATLDQHTDFPYSYVDDETSFKKVVPYIYTSSGWQKAPIFVNNGAWRESNGE